VLDPSRDPSPYLAAAHRRGLRLAFAAQTHLHADFVSGSHELPEARIEIAEVADQPGGTVLDVRQQAEFASDHLPGAHHVELGALTGAGDLPVGPLAVMCGQGERAMTAASLLQRAGHRDLTVLVGGPSGCSRAARRPLEPS
jgi:rhodanese-related sulfurtransferase